MNAPRIALMSDLHLDPSGFALANFEAEVCVLLGDVMETEQGSPIAWAKANIPTHIPTLFVPGNHDFYGGAVGNTLNRWRTEAHGSHIRLLYNETIEVAGVRFLGTPLWSGLGMCNLVDKLFLTRQLPNLVKDFSRIYNNQGKLWRVEDMLEEHRKAIDYLTRELSAPSDKPAVVLTHWAPCVLSLAEKFRGDPANPYFINDLPDLVTKAHLWLHGHTHAPSDYQVGTDPLRGRVICHPRGNWKERSMMPDYDYQPKLIERLGN